jgi:hypothetical protein
VTGPAVLPAAAAPAGFLTGVQDGWHAIDAATIAPGCAGHAWSVCSQLVRVARDDLQPYDPFVPPQSHAPCPACRWAVAAVTGTLDAALESPPGGLARDTAAAVLAWAREEDRDPDDGHVLQLLAAVSRHSPAVLLGEACAEGDCDCGPGECPGEPGCPACSLLTGPWAHGYEGLCMLECTIPAPCAPLLAIAGHFGAR